MRGRRNSDPFAIGNANQQACASSIGDKVEAVA
jgi:hypothetical protein